MSEKKQLNPMVKLALDIGPLVVYFWAFKTFSDTPLEIFGQSYQGLVAAMVFFIPAMLAAVAYTYFKTGALSRMAIFTLVLIVIIGGITLYFNNDTFVKLRPTIFNLLFAGILAFGLYVQKTSYFQWLMGEVMPLKEQGWLILTKGFILLFLMTAIINEIIRIFFSDETFVLWDTIGQMALSLAFLAVLFPRLSKYMITPDQGDQK